MIAGDTDARTAAASNGLKWRRWTTDGRDLIEISQTVERIEEDAGFQGWILDGAPTIDVQI